MVGEKRDFSFFLPYSGIMASQDPLLTFPSLSLGFFISSNERSCLCPWVGTFPEREGLEEDGRLVSRRHRLVRASPIGL